MAGVAMATAFHSLTAADLTWSGGSNSTWNTTSANWNGNTAIWSNSTPPDNAIFDTQPPYLVLMNEDITVGTITVTAETVSIFSLGGSSDVTLTFNKVTTNIPGNPWAATVMGGMTFDLVGSNGVEGRLFIVEDSFGEIATLNLDATSALDGGIVTMAGGSQMNANVADAITGGDQIFVGTSSLNAVVADAITGGTQTFEAQSSLNVSAANGLNGGAQTFTDDSTLNALVANGVVGGTQVFQDSSSLAASVTDAVTGGAQTFQNDSQLVASANGALSGGTQTFEGGASLQANAVGAVRGGSQTFTSTSSLAVNAAGAITGGTQSFQDSSRLVVNVAGGIGAQTITLTEEAGILVQAEDALSNSTEVVFDITGGGTGGFLILDGFDTEVGYVASQAAGAGVIENGGAAAATLSVNTDDFSTEFSGTVRDGGVAALAIDKTGAGTWILSGANTHSGGTNIRSGTLQTENLSALGTGQVQIAGGTLRPASDLTVSSLLWNSGHIRFDLLDFHTLTIDNALTNGGGVQLFEILNLDALGVGDSITLLSFDTTNFTAQNFAAIAVGLAPGLVPITEFIVTDHSVDLVLAGFLASGPVLQNSGPVGIPTTADFLVSGAAATGTPAESNTIRSLIFEGGSSLQVFQTLTVTSGAFDVPVGDASLSGGNVIVPGTFNKLGDGVLNILNTVQVNGAANVNTGSLLVNGTFNANGGLTVFQNALLGGSGIINGNVVNNGIVSPGNSPGILTINGNFTQSSSGTLLIEIESLSVFDQLIVSGNASLAGTLAVLATSLEYGQQYAFLQAASITGEFDQILMPNPEIFRGRLLADGGGVTLVIAPTSYTLVAQTTNQRNVAEALDSFIPASGNDRETVSIALDLLSAEEYPAAFDQIAPSFHESLANITIEQAFAQTQQINQRLSAVRLGARGFQAIGIEAPLVHDKDGKSVEEAKDLKSNVEAIADTNWSAWVMGNGLFGKVTNVSQVPNYNFNSGGFLVGADYSWSESFVTGLYTGYQYTYADYNSAGSTQINSALFGGYATYDADGFYADAVVGGGYNGYRARRGIDFGSVDRTARSQPNGGQFNAALNLGYDWEINKFTFGPIAGVQYTYAGIAPFTEDGADSLNLRVAQQNANSLRTTFGGRVAYTWNITETIALIPEVRMFWQHEFLNNPRNISSALDGGSGPTFGYETSAPARDSVFAGAGVSAQFGQSWNAFFFYNADFGRQDYTGHMISGGVTWKF
jgi:outer membrane autotransporter protein